MIQEKWKTLCATCKTTEHALTAAYSILEKFNPDDITKIPSAYDWDYLILRFKLEAVTVQVDAIKITVSSQTGDMKFGFDDVGACIRWLNSVLVANRTAEELFIRKVYDVYGGTFTHLADCQMLSYEEGGIRIALKAASGVCTITIRLPETSASVCFMISTDTEAALWYLSKYLKPLNVSVTRSKLN